MSAFEESGDLMVARWIVESRWTLPRDLYKCEYQLWSQVPERPSVARKSIFIKTSIWVKGSTPLKAVLIVNSPDLYQSETSHSKQDVWADAAMWKCIAVTAWKKQKQDGHPENKNCTYRQASLEASYPFDCIFSEIFSQLLTFTSWVSKMVRKSWNWLESFHWSGMLMVEWSCFRYSFVRMKRLLVANREWSLVMVVDQDVWRNS